MDDLDHYNLLTVFSLREAACLAAGIDPKRTFLTPRAETILEAMNHALNYWSGCGLGSLVSPDGSPPDSAPPAWVLTPNNLMNAYHARPPLFVDLATTRLLVRKMLENRENLLFGRDELQRWFKAKGAGFSPDYQFGTLTVDKPLPTNMQQDLSDRERTSLLNIVGGLLELVMTPRPGRDSQADVIKELLANYEDKQGISKSKLEAIFAEAKRTLVS